MFSDILTRVNWKPLELEDRYPLYAMTKDLERTIQMADLFYKPLCRFVPLRGFA